MRFANIVRLNEVGEQELARVQEVMFRSHFGFAMNQISFGIRHLNGR